MDMQHETSKPQGRAPITLNSCNNDSTVSTVGTPKTTTSQKHQGTENTIKSTEAAQALTKVNVNSDAVVASTTVPAYPFHFSVAHIGSSACPAQRQGQQQASKSRLFQMTSDSPVLEASIFTAEHLDLDYSISDRAAYKSQMTSSASTNVTPKFYPVEKSIRGLASKGLSRSMKLCESENPNNGNPKPIFSQVEQSASEIAENHWQDISNRSPQDTAKSVPEDQSWTSELEAKIKARTLEAGTDDKDSRKEEEKEVNELKNRCDDGSTKKRSRSFDETLERKKRRRRLRRMLKEAGDFPSFVSLISQSLDEPLEGERSDEEADIDKSPDITHVNIDEYLGLQDNDESMSPVGHAAASAASSGRLRSSRYNGSQIADATLTRRAVGTATPAEEGYYEGRLSLSSGDDDKYLTTLQQLIRNNLEYFSATASDAAGSQAGRRYPIIRGKVGIRCIHCAKIALEHEAAVSAKVDGTPNQPDKPKSSEASDDVFRELKKGKVVDPGMIWPSGSISYPLNIAGLYSICSQKPQLHFEHCPNMPPQVKAQFYRLTHECSKTGEAKIKSREVPAALYYTIAAKRIGLINVPEGLRFGRDLKLEPLPLEAVLAQDHQQNNESAVPVRCGSVSAAQSDGLSSSSERLSADAASEHVLAEALAKADEPGRYLARASDKNYVSDYIFLCIRQLAICRAVPADFATRGKKTKSMRVGFSGFCCRHCQRVREEADGSELARAHGPSDFSCRSFSSVADNLGSAITNTFALHLAKCSNVPRRMKEALSAYKRTHQRQMSQLPYGSQRRVFNYIWERLRAADVPEDEMRKRIQILNLGDQQQSSQPSTRISTSGVRRSSSKPGSKGGNGRSDPSFPVSNDLETLSILKEAEDSLDPNSNGGLILPSDRGMVSDYVFLTIRNLKVALPTPADVAKGRGQTIMAGMCCTYCEKEGASLVSPSGRSFPSAPDNYASALNSSLYNHMQNCHFVPAGLRRAFKNLRGIHSQQIAQLKFGAQRRYFGFLFDRLRKVPLPYIPAAIAEKVRSPTGSSISSSHNSGSRGIPRSRVTRQTEKGDDAILGPFGFFELPCQSFFCLRCRMVPLPFRSRGSLSFARPTIDFMTEHKAACKEDGFDLWFVVESLKKVHQEGFKIDHLTNSLFKEVILNCFAGNADLAGIFTNELLKAYHMSRHGGVSKAVESLIKAKSQGLWSSIPKAVDGAMVVQSFEKFAQMEGMSPRLSEHSALVNFLLLISPTLTLPGDADDDEDDEMRKM